MKSSSRRSRSLAFKVMRQCALPLAALLVSSSAVASVDLVGLNLSGAGFASHVLPGINGTNYIFPTESYFKQWSEKGIKLVRFPIIWERLQPTLGGALDAKYVQLIDSTFSYAEKHNVKIILDLHNYARYRGQIIGTSGVPYARYQEIMTKIAQRWSSQKSLYAYDIMNEPNGALNYWNTAAQYGINGVRAVDTVRPIIVEGNGWAEATRWEQWNNTLLDLKDPSNNLIFSAHTYFDNNAGGNYESVDVSKLDPMYGVERVKPFIEWLKKHGKKGYIGEFGIPDNDSRWNTIMDNMLAYLAQNCVPATYWAAGPGWGNYFMSVEPINGVERPQWPTLKKYVNNTRCTAFGPINGTDATAPSQPAKPAQPAVPTQPATPSKPATPAPSKPVTTTPATPSQPVTAPATPAVPAMPAKPATPAPAPAQPATPSQPAKPVVQPVTPVTRSGIDLVGLNLSGAAFAPHVVPGKNGVDYLYPTEADFKQWNQKGIRLIRFPILWERIQPKLSTMLDPNQVGLIQTTMNLAQKYNIKVILDVHNNGRYNGNIIGAGQVTYTHFWDLMYRIAYRWASHPALYGYDIMAKPHDMDSYWLKAAQSGIDGVRTVDHTHPVIVEGNAWSNASLWPYYNDSLLSLKDSANNIIFAAHVYLDKDGSGTYSAEDTSQLNAMLGVNRAKPFVDWLKKNGKKGYIAEFGVPGDDARWLPLMDNLLSYLQQNCIPATYWAAGPGWGSYKLSVEPVNGQDRPQWATLQKYVQSSNSCTAVGPLK
ncbi:cellulase family glycosylhydrolase [Pseudomonas luteola]|uniref:glycoside hydrolase family 5 protein n=1 Tax=Pseudomonas luteola TaxID=47886 RepID=UPI003DA1478A